MDMTKVQVFLDALRLKNGFPEITADNFLVSVLSLAIRSQK
jgi:hypothetical protein